MLLKQILQVFDSLVKVLRDFVDLIVKAICFLLLFSNRIDNSIDLLGCHSVRVGLGVIDLLLQISMSLLELLLFVADIFEFLFDSSCFFF